MLAPVEADLVRRDAGIPGLATVLDPGAFLDALARAAPGRDLRGARIQYIKYKPRTYCRATYRLDVAGSECELDVRAGRSEDSASRLDEAGGQAVPGPLGSGKLMLLDLAVVVTVFPNDPSLPQVSTLSDPARRIQLLRELLPDRPDLWGGKMRRLRYWSGRRYSAELSGEGAQVLVKAYTRKGYLLARRHAVVFRSSGPLRVARLLGFSDRHRLLAFEWLPGRMLSDLWLSPGIDCKTVTATGAALAALHAQPADGLESWKREDEAAYVRGLAAEIGFLSPHLAARAERLERRLLASLANAPEVRLPVHCDFSDSQVLIDGNDVAIVDLDSARRGDPADDLGAVIAQLESYALSGRLSRGDPERMRKAFLRGYRDTPNGSPVARIGPYTASGLLRRARFAFRARKADWHPIAEATLERAEAVLESPSP